MYIIAGCKLPAQSGCVTDIQKTTNRCVNARSKVPIPKNCVSKVQDMDKTRYRIAGPASRQVQ